MGKKKTLDRGPLFWIAKDMTGRWKMFNTRPKFDASTDAGIWAAVGCQVIDFGHTLCGVSGKQTITGCRRSLKEKNLSDIWQYIRDCEGFDE